MKTELLVRIKEAEDAARSATTKADAEAKSIVSEARRQADALNAEGREQAEFHYQEKLEAARKTATSETNKVLAAGESEAEALRQRFNAGHKAATARVLKLFEERL